MTPPKRSRRRTSSQGIFPGSLIGSRTGRGGAALIHGLVGAVPVVVFFELPQRPQEVALVPDQGAIEKFVAHFLYPALHDRVHAGRGNAGADGRDAGVGEDLAEPGGKLGVPVPDQVRDHRAGIFEVHDQIAGVLSHAGTAFPSRHRPAGPRCPAPLVLSWHPPPVLPPGHRLDRNRQGSGNGTAQPASVRADKHRLLLIRCPMAPLGVPGRVVDRDQPHGQQDQRTGRYGDVIADTELGRVRAHCPRLGPPRAAAHPQGGWFQTLPCRLGRQAVLFLLLALLVIVTLTGLFARQAHTRRHDRESGRHSGVRTVGVTAGFLRTATDKPC